MRTWIASLAFVVLSLVVYWPTVTHEYGFRDDYAHLREVRERPGWLTALTTANGRPVFGVVLEASLQLVDEVRELALLRLTAAVLVGMVGTLLWMLLRRSGWGELYAAGIGAAVVLLPGSQVVVGWAIAWPIALGLVVAVAGFALVDRGLRWERPGRLGWITAGAVLYMTAGLTYQSSALFAVAPLAAVLLMRSSTDWRADTRWTAAHLGILFAGLVAGYLVAAAVVTDGAAPEVARMRIEPHPFIKLLWFLRNPLPNSVALFPLRDRFDTPFWFWLVMAAVVVVIVLGLVYGVRDRPQRYRWLLAALFMPFVAHSVSLAASSQAIGYRTLLPLSGLFLVLAAFGLRAVVARFRVPHVAEIGVLAAVIGVAAVLALRNPYTLLAEPQSREWQLVRAAAERVEVGRSTSVYLIRPSLDYRSTVRVYADEFGTLTADADWAAKEMFKTAMRERFPSGLPAGTEYSLWTAFGPPPVAYDLVVDLRELKNLGKPPRAEATALRR